MAGPEASVAWASQGLPQEEKRDQRWAEWPPVTNRGKVCVREAGRVFSVYQEPRWQDPGWEWGSWNRGHGSEWKDDDGWGGKMMGVERWRCHKAGDPEAESAQPVRTHCRSAAEPGKMADSAEARKERDKEVTKDRGSSSLLLPSQHLSSTQHFFPEFPSQKTLQNTVTMEWETVYPYKSPSVSGLQRIPRLNLSWKWQLFPQIHQELALHKTNKLNLPVHEGTVPPWMWTHPWSQPRHRSEVNINCESECCLWKKADVWEGSHPWF